MDGTGPVLVETHTISSPRTAVEEWTCAPRTSGLSAAEDRQLIRRLLTPAQRLKYSLVPGTLYGWMRSMRRWRRGEPELQLLAGLVDPHRTAVDVGANKGTYTWPLARLCRHVYAYEPNPAMRWMLQKSTPANVTVFPRALSDVAGIGELRIPRRGGRFSNNIGTLRDAFQDTGCESIPVTVTRLDDDGLADVGFLKIDVEGHERQVLEGARETIARNRPVLLVEIIAEHTGSPVDETIELIERLGYRAHVTEGSSLVEWRRHSPSSRRLRNYVFLPTSRTAKRAA